MASKTHKANNGHSPTLAAQAGNSAPDAALAFSQDQLQSLIALTDVVFKGAEEIHRFQMQAAHDARLQHEKAQAQVSQAATPADLLNLQSELLRFDMASAGKYWQQLAAICAATQADAMNLITRSAATVGGDMARLAAQPLPQVMPLQTATAPRESGATAADPTQAWNQWVDLGKQWSDMLYRTEASLH
ncbi:MAG: phasin family protein [Cytophagales bacterium]|nr:phasin family protein [Rhizobacter sp.]